MLHRRGGQCWGSQGPCLVAEISCVPGVWLVQKIARRRPTAGVPASARPGADPGRQPAIRLGDRCVDDGPNSICGAVECAGHSCRNAESGVHFRTSGTGVMLLRGLRTVGGLQERSLERKAIRHRRSENRRARAAPRGHVRDTGQRRRLPPMAIRKCRCRLDSSYPFSGSFVPREAHSSAASIVEDAQLDGRVVICEHFRSPPRASWGVLVRDDRHSAGASLLRARAQEIDDGPDGFCGRWL
jgi:hypothetical protein